MKLKFSCYTILLIIIVDVECGLVKQFFGNVKEDVHTVVDNTVNVIGKGTHKLTEGLGIFLHRKEGSKFPTRPTEAPNNHIASVEKHNNDGVNDYEPEVNTDKKQNSESDHHAKPSSNYPSVNNDTHVPENVSNHQPAIESDINKNANIIHDHTVVPTQPTNIGTSTEPVPLFSGAELENILPTMSHNETHFTDHLEGNSAEKVPNTNELGTGENQTYDEKSERGESNNTNGDDTKKTTESNSNKIDLVSDQMFFKDNKPKLNESDINTNKDCAEGLVKAANGDCLKQLEIDLKKKNEPMVFNIFQADGCPSGYARALDGTCQKIVG